MKAERPVIWAGGGVISSGAGAELLALAEHLQAPVITTPEGKGAISDRHYLSIGVTRGRSTGQTRDGLRMYFWERDVILAVGTRFAGVEALPEQKVVQVDVDQEELGRNHADTLGVAGDAKEALSQSCWTDAGRRARPLSRDGRNARPSGPNATTPPTRSNPWAASSALSGTSSPRTASWSPT